MATLTAKKIEAIREPGRYGDGGGLYLVVRPAGSKGWAQRIVIDGRRRDIGLGGFPTVSLARAREKASANRTAVADGRDPQTEKRKPSLPTFREAAERYVTANRPRWRNSKTAVNWLGSLSMYTYPNFGDTRVDRITRADVVAALEPIWTIKPSMARKLRQRVRAVFAYAQAHGHIEINPAGEAINAALPSMPGVKEHFRSLPYQEVGVALRTVDASSASWSAQLCLRFLVLTAVRSGEARGAMWDEIDLSAKTWTIPGSRMKAGLEHRVPLSDAAIDVLAQARALEDNSGLVFPSALRPGYELSDMTLTKLLRSTGLAERATVHGFRTSFKTWCMEQTDTPWAVGEAALAHSLGNSTEVAYARSDLFERRRALMDHWAAFLSAISTSSASP
jgi:integrase